MSRRKSQREGDTENVSAEDDERHPRLTSCGNGAATEKSWMNSYWDNMMNEEMDMSHVPIFLPWRIGLFLLTSTITQNMNYVLGSFATTNYFSWTTAQQKQFYSLCYNMLYLGPVFGLIVDLIRVGRERFRPVIIIACVINAIVCFVCFATKNIENQYSSMLVLAWIMQVATMFIYMPMNAVVINYGNRLVESSHETSARIGGLMSQAMVWRTAGSLIQTIFYQFAYGDAMKPYVNYRWMCLIAGICCCVLILQVLFLTKRYYYTDYRRAAIRTSEPVVFYRNTLNMGKQAISTRKEAFGGRFMFILCFTFIYFMLPDALYNTKFSFEYQYTETFSLSLRQANSILGSLGALLGALAYALWMYFAQHSEASHGRMFRANPFIICLAGCSAWAFGTFFHFWGVMGSTNGKFNYNVFIPIESVVVSACLRFAFMPTLSLAAMQAPRFYETAAFQLYSVSVSGGGVVSTAVTVAFMSSLGVTEVNGYWKALPLFMLFQFVPMVIAPTLPKFREDETLPAAGENDESLEADQAQWREPSTYSTKLADARVA
ncbi:BT1 family/MFS/sugar transport protein [Leishmania donovani]|uniref:BT1_family/MFS/sugar_transport_protein_putative/P fam:PF03092/Pfam:PF13347 n=1 Tax=Leishmania donovani TaxID=5661 RepID=A0A504X0H5_LEIDO|nr:MFS/sugar transport family protein [Leishmania donovani]CAJ1991178.1 BT1 family/MFS/sugar transport protein [Leishmania donovani]VDZ47024.1 BT1_family/MFS/sugar_transport_protein_putative/Pfam:PF03092/Pfam:PF13347 [Leishmania donovani]